MNNIKYLKMCLFDLVIIGLIDTSFCILFYQFSEMKSNERSGYLMKDERYSPRTYEIVYDFYGELKLTVRANYLCVAVIGADLIVKGILGFVPKRLSIREIKDKEK